MKTPHHLTFVLITALGVSSLTACNEKKTEVSEDLQEMQMEQDANDRIKEMRDNIKQEQEEFIVQARTKIEENKRDIEDLKLVAKTKTGEAKAKYEQGIENLKAENERLEAKMDENKKATNENWDNFKEEFNSDMDRLGASIADLFKDNK